MALLNAHGSIVYTTFDIPAGSSTVGTFSIANSGLGSIDDLSFTGSFTHYYAYRFFTPSVTGTYTLGMTYASYDPVMILYSGQSSFPVDPADGALAIDDDGWWDISGGDWYDPGTSYSYGTQTVDPTAAGGEPYLMPLIKDQSMTAGINYLVAITTYQQSVDPIPLPASFFVAGPGAVTLDGGAEGAPVPEPGTWGAAALLAGGAAFMRWRKRVKVS